MADYDFTYELPDNFQQSFIRFLIQNGVKNVPQLLSKSVITYDDAGLAYYAGLKGDVWNKRALDFTIQSSADNIQSIKTYFNVIKSWLDKFISPSVSGYLTRKIDFIVRDVGIDVELPQNRGDDFEALNQDIAESLSQNEPTMVLDRLHTFSVKFIRDICTKHDISISSENGDFYPLHSLVGSLVKYYIKNNIIESDFSERALKSSISLFESYNFIRNDKSYAHDNKVLSKQEAEYVVKIVSATLSYIEKIEKGKGY